MFEDPPFEGDSKDEIISKVSEGRLDFETEEWSSVSNLAKNFISRLISVKISNRYSAKEALQDPWIKKY